MPKAVDGSNFHERHRNLSAVWDWSCDLHATGMHATHRPLRPVCTQPMVRSSLRQPRLSTI